LHLSQIFLSFAADMMKRRLSILMIMLANILILAHAVVPHHHHNKMFVAIVNVLDDNARDLFNHEHSHSHHHDGNNQTDNPAHHHDSGTEDCLMYEAEAAAALKNQTDDEGKCTIAPSQNSDDGMQILLYAIGLYELTLHSTNSDDHVWRRPYVIRGHSDYVARAKGLRAPPTC
jgi:hypothetical protein